MTLPRIAALSLILTCLPPLLADSFVLGADGQWTRVETRETDGRRVLTIDPPANPGGRTTLVLDKPDWMVLDDSEPPMITGAQLADAGLDTETLLDLGVSDGKPSALSVGVVDSANPVDVARATLRLGEFTLRPETAPDAAPSRNALLRFALPEFQPGNYDGELTVPDRSPLRNALRMPVRLSVFGVRIAPENQGLALSALGNEFRVDPGARLPIVIGAGGPQAYVTGQIAGTYMYPREITATEMVVDEPDRKVCRVSTKLGEHDGAVVDKPGRYEYDLEVRQDLPCLIVRSRLMNELQDGEVYCFWGWLPGQGFVTPSGPAEWSMAYGDLGAVGWVYLPPTGAAKRGIGWISPLVFGQSRFGTMLLYTSPQKVKRALGESVEMPFALMPADSPEQVAEVAEKLSALGVWDAPQ